MTPDPRNVPFPGSRSVSGSGSAGPGGTGGRSGEDGRLLTRHGPDFVAAWRSVFCDVYGWRQEGRFAVVPSLFGKPVFACLPGLNYSDLGVAEARAIAREMAGRSFNVRVLDTTPGEPPPGAPAVLRLDLAAFGHEREAVWKRALNHSARKGVRRARKADLRVSEERGRPALGAFFGLLAATLARHGAPIMPVALFEALIGALDARILAVRNGGDGEALASLLWLRDGPLAWVPWLGSRLRSDRPGDLLFWAMVEHALNEGVDVVDFGRSSNGDGACRFKRKFGAVPVPVLWLSDKRTDLHRRYAPAQRLWRALPAPVTGRLGPRLCRYLADY